MQPPAKRRRGVQLSLPAPFEEKLRISLNPLPSALSAILKSNGKALHTDSMVHIPLKLFNTLGRKKQSLKTIEDRLVKLYTCGPTVYDFAHIGNLRAYVFEDLLKRTLLFNGFKVFHVMNITDVGHLVSDSDTGEDKMEKGAAREHKTVWDIAKFYTDAFMEDIERLNIIPAEIICKATDHIKEQIELVQKLEEKGFTYTIEDGVYFDTLKLKDYGKLAGAKSKEGLIAGARVEVVEGKKNPTDFALWKFSLGKKRQMEWPSKWGVGFPGWHIECSAMSMKYLGEHFDIHCGGVDHIPIHHTNEIAQSEAATGKPFANYWLHCEFLQVNGQKMSKSLGNFYTLRDLLGKGFSQRAIRYFLLSAHYRTQQNLTLEGLKKAEETLSGLTDFLDRITGMEAKGEYNKKLGKAVKKSQESFLKALNDDLNLPSALSVLFNIVKETNRAIEQNKIGKKNSEEVLKTLIEFDRVFGVLEHEKTEVPQWVRTLVEEREKARREKDFAESDNIRKKILEAGWIVEDTPRGPRLRRE